MARDIDMSDPDSWDDDDKAYLAQRGELPEDVMSVADQRKLLDPHQSENRMLLEDFGNTGTVEVLSTEALEAELERRRTADGGVDDNFDPRTLFSKEGRDGARRTQAEEEGEGEDDSDRISGNYEDYKKAQLSGELQARNTEREDDDDYEPLALSGTHQELVDRLTEDDESRDEE